MPREVNLRIGILARSVPISMLASPVSTAGGLCTTVTTLSRHTLELTTCAGMACGNAVIVTRETMCSATGATCAVTLTCARPAYSNKSFQSHNQIRSWIQIQQRLTSTSMPKRLSSQQQLHFTMWNHQLCHQIMVRTWDQTPVLSSPAQIQRQIHTPLCPLPVRTGRLSQLNPHNRRHRRQYTDLTHSTTQLLTFTQRIRPQQCPMSPPTRPVRICQLRTDPPQLLLTSIRPQLCPTSAMGMSLLRTNPPSSTQVLTSIRIRPRQCPMPPVRIYLLRTDPLRSTRLLPFPQQITPQQCTTPARPLLARIHLLRTDPLRSTPFPHRNSTMSPHPVRRCLSD